MWAVVTIGQVKESDGLVRNADIVGESSKRQMVGPSKPIKINRDIFAVSGSTAAALVESYVAICDRGRKKDVAIEEGG